MDHVIDENYYNVCNPIHVSTSYVVKQIDKLLIIDEYKVNPFVDPRSPRNLIEDIESIHSESDEVEEVPVVEVPVEVKPVEVVEVKPVEVKPVEVKPVEVVEVKPVEVKPVEVKVVEPVEEREQEKNANTIFKNMFMKAKNIYRRNTPISHKNKINKTNRINRLNMHRINYINMY